MSVQLKVPSLGESITEATIGAWLKKEGEPVQADEPVVEVESEKATVAVPAPAAGILRRVLRGSGDAVAVGEVIGEIEEGARPGGPLAMSIPLKVPSLGESVTQATVGAWLKKEGDAVAADEPVVEDILAFRNNHRRRPWGLSQNGKRRMVVS